MKQLVCLTAILLGSCATSRQQALSELAQSRLQRAEELHAETLAPQHHRAFRAASARARDSKLDSPERGDYGAEARLWLEAAISEAERSELSRLRLQVEREAVASDELYLASEQQRLAAEREIELRAAGEIARIEAQRSLARAALLPAQRTKLSTEEIGRAASALLVRTELLLLSVPRDAAQQADREQLGALLKEARSLLGKSPDRALELADRALFGALSLVGKLRNGEPSEPQRASLAEALQLAGANVRRAEQGLTASVPKAPARSIERSLARLCSVARAYPAGQVQLKSASGAALPRLFEQQGCRGDRFVVGVQARDAARGPSSADPVSVADEALSMTFVAY